MILRGGMILAALVALHSGLSGEARAVSLQVNCGGGAPFVTIQSAVDAACSNDTISVVGTCTEAVVVNLAGNTTVCATGDGLPFTKLTITGSSGGSNNPLAGPAFLITGNARNITISNFTVGSGNSHGIQVMSAHRVTLQNIRTAPSTAPGIFAFLDGINIDTLSTRARVLSSVLNNNGGDGVENGSTYGEVTSVTANDNGAVGINVTGANLSVTRCKADETSAGNVQQEGYRFDGPGAIVQQCNAKDNVVAQFRDTATSTGVIHFRNIAGNGNATVIPAGLGIGFLEEGMGNRINTCQAHKNASHGVHLAGSGNTLQLSTINQNVGDQVRITGDNNLIQENGITRVSLPNIFFSTTPAVNAPALSDSNFFDRNRVSVASGSVTGDGYTVVEPTNNGTQNTRSPGDPNDPPANLR